VVLISMIFQKVRNCLTNREREREREKFMSAIKFIKAKAEIVDNKYGL
jgi:hypothetical protein